MNENRKDLYDRKSDVSAALGCIRQAISALPEDLEELLEDLKWVEESLQETLAQQECENCFSPLSHERMGA